MAKNDISTYCISALVVCAAAEAGFLRNQELLQVFENGLEEKIVSVLKSIGEKEQSDKLIADALIRAVEYVKPSFPSGLINSLRFAAISWTKEREEEERTELESLTSWKSIVEPVLTKAMSVGFELNSDLADFSDSVVFCPQGKKVDAQEFVHSVTKEERTRGFMTRLLSVSSEAFTFLAYKNREANVLVLIGQPEQARMRVPLPHSFDAELTIEKPFVFWVICISGGLGISPEWSLAIDRSKTRSKSFKHPFLFAFTSPSQVNALFGFLLNQATKKTVSG